MLMTVTAFRRPCPGRVIFPVTGLVLLMGINAFGPFRGLWGLRILCQFCLDCRPWIHRFPILHRLFSAWFCAWLLVLFFVWFYAWFPA